MKKTSLTEFIGTGKELLLSELPTYRDTLRHAVLLREQCDKNSRTFLIKDMAKKLDKLFGILNCKCQISYCNEFGCKVVCKQQAHITCNCSKEFKIPIIDIFYIKTERDKVGARGLLQKSSKDLPEYNKQVKTLHNHSIKEAFKRKREESITTNKILSNDFSMTEDELFYEEFNLSYSKIKKSKYNTKSIRNVAINSLRYGVSSRAAAALTTAAWIDAGLISEKDTQFIVDHQKIARAQAKIMIELKNETLKSIYNRNINCILFDSRKDITKVKLEVEGFSNYFPVSINEEHYTTCMEPGGKFLFHFTPKKSTEEEKHADIVTNHLVEWMIQHGVDKSIQALGGDSTNVNTGWEKSVIQFVELKLNKRLNWLICALHTNELPLRHLIVELDGKTLSNNKWSGELGKLLDTVTDLDANKNFEKITLGEPLIVLPGKILKDLSTDQAYGYRIVTAIRSGVLPENLINLEIEPVSHSRWLTTVNRFCRLWVSIHFLTG
nr:uncharacterized protein LOC124808520 [Hydra vulgaris]